MPFNPSSRERSKVIRNTQLRTGCKADVAELREITVPWFFFVSLARVFWTSIFWVITAFLCLCGYWDHSQGSWWLIVQRSHGSKARWIAQKRLGSSQFHIIHDCKCLFVFGGFYVNVRCDYSFSALVSEKAVGFFSQCSNLSSNKRSLASLIQTVFFSNAGHYSGHGWRKWTRFLLHSGPWWSLGLGWNFT